MINKIGLRRITGHIVVWIGVVLVSYTLLLGFMPPLNGFIRAVLMGFMTAVAHYCNAFIFNRTVARNKIPQYGWMVVLLGLTLSVMRILLEKFVFPAQIMPYYFHENPLRPIVFTAGTFVVLFVSFIVLYGGFLTKKEKMLLQAVSTNNEARLRYLQSHINPHFLFNALNNLYSLVITRSEKAPETLLMLTDLLRYSVYQKEGAKVPVSLEAEQIEMLIKLFTLRREEPYRIDFNLIRAAGNIEPMILVPLAENCLKHCDFDLNPHAYASMQLVSDESELRFETENTFTPRQVKDIYGGVGLGNMKERMELIYGEDATLAITQTGNIFSVKLQILWKHQ